MYFDVVLQQSVSLGEIATCIVARPWRKIYAKKTVERPPEEMFLPNIASRGARHINCPRFLLVSRTHKNSIMRAYGVKSHNLEEHRACLAPKERRL